jgi:hypothetical protein
MEMNPHGESLGCNPPNNASYRNLGMMLNWQGSGHHPLGGASYLDLDTVLSEQELGHHILSDVLHRRSNVVKNAQGSSYLTRRM